MFETLVAGLLTSALGSFIEPKCFSSDKIHVSVWSGYVVLKELAVKPEVLAELPAVTLLRGLVGSLELKIPWNRLQSDSVVATVDDVYLLLRMEEDVDAVVQQMDEFTLKKKLLEELYAQAKTQGEDKMESDQDGFAARLFNKIIDNLELHIRRIHVRIEDHNTGDHPFALGLTIESVHIQSTNSSWQPSFVDTFKSIEPRIFKIIELNHLSVYCNPDCELQRDDVIDFKTCSAEEFSTAFSRAIPKRFDDKHYHHMHMYPTTQQHHFLLKPVDASGKLIVNRDLSDANVPKFEVDVNMLEVAFRLEESQYCDLLYLASAIQSSDHYVKYRRYRKIRPHIAVTDDPAEWWKYAIRSVIQDVKTKRLQNSWNHMKERRDDRKCYVSLWQQRSSHLLELVSVDYEYSDSEDNNDIVECEETTADDNQRKNSAFLHDNVNTPRLSSSEIDIKLEEIERRRSVEDVLFFRYLADNEVQKCQVSRNSHVRRRLPTPPIHTSQNLSDGESVDTELTELSVPAEVRYRSWGAWIFGWTSKLATLSSDGKSGRASHKIPEVELRELFNILEEPCRRSKKRMHKHRDFGEQDPNDDSQLDFGELFRVAVTLQRGSLTLASDPETGKTLSPNDLSYGRKYNPTDFLLMTFSQLQVAAVARDDTVVVDMSLQSVEAFDESAESSAFSRLLCRKQTFCPTCDGDDVDVSKLSGVVFLMSCELNPANSSADASLFVHLDPLQIVLSPTAQCWGRLAQFMETPASLGLWRELEVASLNDIVNFKARTEAKLDYVMKNRIALAVDLRIQTPVIIVPESDSDYNCARLVVDLGRISFRTARLSQIDSERHGGNSRSRPPSSSSIGSFVHRQDMNSTTSFVQQLCDEAEIGEDALRWKEEFYDKFNLSVTNIHVLLIPYGKTSRAQDVHRENSEMSFPSVSLPQYLMDNYDDMQEYELVERFNINVIVRMSILPLDATLTRLYIHADLPALTFNLSLDKYYQLLALGNCFSLTPRKDSYWRDGLFSTDDTVIGTIVDMNYSRDLYNAMRSDNILSSLSLDESKPESEGALLSNTDVLPDIDGSDGNSSVESDDTWFSIANSNLDMSSFVEDGDLDDRERSHSISGYSDSVIDDGNKILTNFSRLKRRALKKPRPYETTKLLDRKLVVCSFTVPLISMQLKKPRSSYTAYRYDMSEFDDDPANNGTILVKLQGFRVRVGQKTLSTLVNVSLRSLEVEDISGANNRSAQYLVFSSPAIAAPFMLKAPLRRSDRFAGYSVQHRRPSKQRDEVITFSAVGTEKNGPRSNVLRAPDMFVELGFSSFYDQHSGKEVLRDIDLQLGSVHFNFDQRYVCSLLELFEEPATQLATAPASSEAGVSDIDDYLPSPFELTPSIIQEYSIAVNLTESVRADLERARKSLFEQAPHAGKTATRDRKNDLVPIALKLDVRIHSVSVCFTDRGESMASVAILDSALRIGKENADCLNVSGLIGDVKVFDLSSKMSPTEKTGDVTSRGSECSALEYCEILGSDTSSTYSSDKIKHLLSVSTTLKLDSKGAAKDEEQAQGQQHTKSSVRVLIQPIRLLVVPEFVENLTNYVVGRTLHTHFQSKGTTLIDESERAHNRTDSVGSEFQLPLKSSPVSECPPGSLTPFFDAVEASNKDSRQLKPPTSNIRTISHDDKADNMLKQQSNHTEKGDHMTMVLAYILDNFDVDFTLCHPCVVLTATPLNDIRLMQPSRGIVFDFGLISFALQRKVSESLPNESTRASYQTKVTVEGFQITSLADQSALLNPLGFEVQGTNLTQSASTIVVEEVERNVADVHIFPVCVNVSETNVCLALEIFYEAIVPIVDTFVAVIHQSANHNGVLVVDSADLLDSEKRKGKNSDDTAPMSNINRAIPGPFTAHFLLEEVKIAFFSYSGATTQLDMWMKSAIRIPDDVSSQENSGAASLAAQGRSYSQISMERTESFSSDIPCVIGEIALSVFKASLSLDVTDTQTRGSELQCNFSLQKAVIRDDIVDSAEYRTQLLGPIPELLEERTKSCALTASESVLSPLLRHSTPQSQLSGRFASNEDIADESVVTINSLDLSLSSARLIVLPRSLLRLEHFVLDMVLAVGKKWSELVLQRDEAMTKNCPDAEGSTYVDREYDPENSREKRQEIRFRVPHFRSRSDSVTESLKDDLNSVRSALTFPLQHMLRSTSAKDGRGIVNFTPHAIAEGSGSKNSIVSEPDDPVNAIEAGMERQRLQIPQWKVSLSFSNMQLWLVSTDRVSDVAGCVLSCHLVAKVDSTHNQHAGSLLSDSSNFFEFLTASARLNDVKIAVDTLRVNDTEQQKQLHQSGTLVEDFEVDIQVALRQCFRPALEEISSPETMDGKTDEKVDSKRASGDKDQGLGDSDDRGRQGSWIHTSAMSNAVAQKIFLRDTPSEWQEWVSCETSVLIDPIVSHVAYQDLPLLLKISSVLISILDAENSIRGAFTARFRAAEEELDWAELPDTSEYAHYFGVDDVNGHQAADNTALLSPPLNVLTCASVEAKGVQLQMMNIIADQASPVLEFDLKTIDVLLRSELNSRLEIMASCRAEAMYQNLRLVTTEPLIEPWGVQVKLRQKYPQPRWLDDGEQIQLSPRKLEISSDAFLQVNLTDALIANLVAADRAWRWVLNANGDSREMTDYSTYWIRNNSGMVLRYWGSSCDEHVLAPGDEEALRFTQKQSSGDSSVKFCQEYRDNAYVRDRHLFIAVEEKYKSDRRSMMMRQWQSEAPIAVDQVDSRMYALVDHEADVSATWIRKCECVIDVFVERGCKYFVVRSTLNLENRTASDLEVEFVLSQRPSMSRSTRAGHASLGHIIPTWKKLVKASSIVPVPLHIVSSGDGYVMVRPPEISGVDTSVPKAYAKERVQLPVFDRGSSPHIETDESLSTIKFRRLYSDRPVRPFMMNVFLSNSSAALYHRTLSFHPPLIIHNLTAEPLDFCLATPNHWSPAVETGSHAATTGVNAGWETQQQRLRERGTINVADSLLWHVSSEETPLELSVRMKGFEWSERLDIDDDLEDLVRMKMKDLLSDAYIYLSAEVRISKGHCRELFLYVPYWIVNVTGLQLEFEYEKERMGPEHKTAYVSLCYERKCVAIIHSHFPFLVSHLVRFLAGQNRLDREELLLREGQRNKTVRRSRNPHLLYPAVIEDQTLAEDVQSVGRGAPSNLRESERKRRHSRLLPSVPPIKGLLDLLPKAIEADLPNPGQVEVLQACHSDFRMDRGCVRLRVKSQREMAAMDARKGHGQPKWSNPFALDLVGTSGEIEAENDVVDRKFSIGYSINPAKGQYSRTKVIMLTPRFVLINTMENAIEVCHSSSKMMTPSMFDTANGSGPMSNSRVISSINPVVELDAEAYADFHWTLRFAKTRTIRCRFAETGWLWSGAVPLVESGEYAVRMCHESTRESKLVRVTLKLEASCVCAYFREEPTTTPPYRVENYSLETLRTHQYRVRRSEILLPHHSLDYAWDEPTEPHFLVVDMLPSAAGDNSRPLRIGSFDLDRIQRYPDALGGTLGIEISTDGPTRVLRFTDTRLREKRGVSSSSQAANATDADEKNTSHLLQTFVTAPTLHTALRLQGVGISVVDNAPKELIYISIADIAVELLVSENDRKQIGTSATSLSRLERETRPRILACCVEISDVQIDNQLQGTPYPVLLRFSTPNGRIPNGQMMSHPVLQGILVKHDEYAGIDFIRHFSVSSLPVHIRVDGALLYQILPLLAHVKVYNNEKLMIKKRGSVVSKDGRSSNKGVRAAHNQLVLEDFVSSLEVQVKVLAAARKEEATSAKPSSCSATSLTTILPRRNSSQTHHKQLAALAADKHFYTALKNAKFSAIAAKVEQKKLYFEEFHVKPICATVSFSFGNSADAIMDRHVSSLSHAAAFANPSLSRGPSAITVGPLRLILNAIGTSLTKIANAPFHLKALHIHHSFVQPDALATRLASHYQSEALRQAYVILGSVDVLGNPMIAWKNLSSGFQDFISEPAHGLSQKSPQAFALGVGRGSLSLLRASVYTFLDFYTRILTAFSLGLSEACLKLDDYTGYPATPHIFQGLVQGLSGVVVAPIHSFEVNGIRGVFPGLMAGAFGLVLKPLLGFALATAKTTAMLRDAVDPNTKALLVRLRPPRHINLRTKRLKVYSYVESFGEEIVGKIRGGLYRADGYLGHVDLKATHQCFLVTRKRILCLNVKGTAQTAKYEVQWELLAEEVVMVDCCVKSKEQIMIIYYIGDEFRFGAEYITGSAHRSNALTTIRRWTPGLPRGMFLQKHEVVLPDTKVLFVRAMLQQQERSLLTKMNSYTQDVSPTSVPLLTRTKELKQSAAWQPQQLYIPLEYPIFRVPQTLQRTRSFANLAQASHSQSNINNQQLSQTENTK
ncbi:hypothetical protein PsorP6_009273 [Peronosclerospora sorghi]|uniref:Uncharacterized protein n=1 Tax=Peronosclerospora sorghi TaxID=230839 RepID=A0ACC0W1F9_9STRA|nr:hypothetical protein PsorP6_009273 [Peronosclerospora sorghi]